MNTKLNIELKCYCNDFKSIRSTLKSLGVRRMIIKKQVDYFFNLPKGKARKFQPYLKLRKENRKQILVFYERPLLASSAKPSSRVFLLPIKNPNILSVLSQALGINTIVKKRRELWQKGNTVFHLDAVEGVGNIFEIEVWSTPRALRKDRLKFRQYKSELMPHLGKVIKTSNKDLASRSRSG